jgi:hypothetical protein
MVRLHTKTKDRLDRMKNHPRETYDDVIQRLLTTKLAQERRL